MTIKSEPILEIPTSLGEGSLWCPELNSLLWLDINNGRVYIYHPDTGINDEYCTGEMVGTVVYRQRGGLIVALRNGIAALDLSTGTVSPLVSIEQDKEGTRFNDGKCDPAGRLWAGTMGLVKPREPGCLYVINPDLSVRAMVENTQTSNGLAWHESTMYYVDSPLHTIDAFDYDQEKGEISARRTVITIPEEHGTADGITLDENGNIWAAHYRGGTVRCYDPRSGKTHETIDIPGAINVTSCAFGGENYETLYITTASQGLDESTLSRYPASGFLFAANVGVKGVRPYSFAG